MLKSSEVDYNQRWSCISGASGNAGRRTESGDGVVIQRAHGVRADQGNRVFPIPGIFVNTGQDTRLSNGWRPELFLFPLKRKFWSNWRQRLCWFFKMKVTQIFNVSNSNTQTTTMMLLLQLRCH